MRVGNRRGEGEGEEEEEKGKEEAKWGGGGGRRRWIQLMMTGRNTLLQNYLKVIDGPVGAGKKIVGRISCYLPQCQVSSLYTTTEIVWVNNPPSRRELKDYM